MRHHLANLPTEKNNAHIGTNQVFAKPFSSIVIFAMAYFQQSRITSKGEAK